MHGCWDDARDEVERRIDEIVSADELEKLLDGTREAALKPAERLLWQGSGWGALENLRRKAAGLAPMCAHLDFGRTDAPQESWERLLTDGSMGIHDAEKAPASWMRQTEWTRLMEKAADGKDLNNWYTLLQLGCTYLAQPDILRAEIYIGRSLAERRTAWGLYVMAELKRIRGDRDYAALMAEAADLAKNDASLAKIAARALHLSRDWKRQISFTDSRPASVRALPRLRLYRAYALASAGEFDEAEALLSQDGAWLQVPDIQEGEVTLSDLWYMIEEGKAARRGVPFDRDGISPPHELDFRMFAKE